MNGLEVKGGRIKTGYGFLDDLLGLGNGIITLRSGHQWLLDLVCRIMVKNFEPGKRMLYLHWVDYHKRFWTLDYDFILSLAKRYGIDVDEISENIYFIRAFSKDNNDVSENWERLSSLEKVDLIILDSVGELYDENKGSKTMTYAIGNFVRLCMKNDCVGIVLDRSERDIHTYLAHVSSIIIEFNVRQEIVVKLLKHPCMPDVSFYVPRNGQYTMRRWLC